MTLLIKLQNAWRCQPGKKFDGDPETLLKVSRLERRTQLFADIFVIAVLSFVGLSMLRSIHDIHTDWPWLIYTACMAWVVGFIVFNQWRRPNAAPRFDEPMLAHVEWSIKSLEHRMRQDRYTFWWYTLPIALGCILPDAIFFGKQFARTPTWPVFVAFAGTLAMFAAVFTVIHIVISRGLRRGYAARLEELAALRKLRDELISEPTED